MKKMFFVNFVCLLVMFSCSKKENKDCGAMKEFKVDADYCFKMNLPEVEFKVKYPANFKTDSPNVGEQNYQYNYFLKWDKNETQTEAISFGYSTVHRNSPMKADLVMEILPQIKSMYEQIGFTLSDVFIGKDKFNGKSYYQFRAKGTVHNKEKEFVGDYLILCLIVEQEVDDKNGLLVMMLANQDSEIKEFEDFASKGCVSEIWKSLQFN